MRRLTLMTLVALFLPGCSPTGPEMLRQPGVIKGFNENDPQIRVSTAGRDVFLSVTTYGTGCFEKGETEAVVDGLEATVRPYDYRPIDGACPRDLVSFEHATTLRFTGPGTVRIVVHGLTAEVDPNGKPMTVELSVDLE